MVAHKWDGSDRRKQPGRRDCDHGVCELHSMVMETCKGKQSEAVQRIETLFGLVDKMVSWRVFTFVAVLAVGVIGAGFGFFGAELRSQGQEQVKTNDKIFSTLSSMAAVQAVTLVKIERLEKDIDNK